MIIEATFVVRLSPKSNRVLQKLALRHSTLKPEALIEEAIVDYLRHNNPSPCVSVDYEDAHAFQMFGLRGKAAVNKRSPK